MVKYILIIVTAVFANFAYSQISFYEKYLGNGHDIGNGIVEVDDSAYVICGTSTTFQNGSAQAILMKVDSMGQHVWAKQYGGPETETAKRIFYTEGEGFYVFGETDSTSNGDIDLILYRMNDAGDLISESKFGTPAWDQITDAIKFSDSSYALVGLTYNTADGETDGYIVRLDKFGDTLFTLQSNMPGPDRFNGVINYYDTAFVIGGSAWNADSSMSKSYIASYDIDGTLEWEKLYGDNGNYGINDVEKYNGNILTVGYHISTTTGLRNDYGLRTDSIGNVLFTFAYDVPGYRSYDHITKYGPNNRLYVGVSNDDNATTGPGKDCFASDFSDGLFSFGTYVLITGSFDDEIGEIISTSDGGAVMVGSNRDIVPENPSLFILKIGEGQDYPNTDFPHSTQSILSIVENENLTSQFLIYPNPAKDAFFVENKIEQEGSLIEIINITGNVVLQQKASKSLTKIEAVNLKQGVYFVQMTLDTGVQLRLGKVTIH